MALPVVGKVILDTNIFIDYLRAELDEDWIFGRVGPSVRYLSSVVLLELSLGADTLRRRREVQRIRESFPKGRVVAPAPEFFERAGELFRSMYSSGNEPTDRLASVNDILIALTAWRMGATLVTRNLEDFSRIGDRLPGLATRAP